MSGLHGEEHFVRGSLRTEEGALSEEIARLYKARVERFSKDLAFVRETFRDKYRQATSLAADTGFFRVSSKAFSLQYAVFRETEAAIKSLAVEVLTDLERIHDERMFYELDTANFAFRLATGRRVETSLHASAIEQLEADAAARSTMVQRSHTTQEILARAADNRQRQTEAVVRRAAFALDRDTVVFTAEERLEVLKVSATVRTQIHTDKFSSDFAVAEANWFASRNDTALLHSATVGLVGVRGESARISLRGEAAQQERVLGTQRASRIQAVTLQGNTRQHTFALAAATDLSVLDADYASRLAMQDKKADAEVAQFVSERAIMAEFKAIGFAEDEVRALAAAAVQLAVLDEELAMSAAESRDILLAREEVRTALFAVAQDAKRAFNEAKLVAQGGEQAHKDRTRRNEHAAELQVNSEVFVARQEAADVVATSQSAAAQVLAQSSLQNKTTIDTAQRTYGLEVTQLETDNVKALGVARAEDTEGLLQQERRNLDADLTQQLGVLTAQQSTQAVVAEAKRASQVNVQRGVNALSVNAARRVQDAELMALDSTYAAGQLDLLAENENALQLEEERFDTLLGVQETYNAGTDLSQREADLRLRTLAAAMGTLETALDKQRLEATKGVAGIDLGADETVADYDVEARRMTQHMEVGSTLYQQRLQTITDANNRIDRAVAEAIDQTNALGTDLEIAVTNQSSTYVSYKYY